MPKQYLNPPITQIMGSYSLGVKVDVGDAEMIFVTGQMAMDKDGLAVAPGDFAQQAEYIYRNIEKILNEGHASLKDVVKTTTYITDMSKFSEFSAIRDQYLAESKPASTLVEISKLSKEGCDIEIEVVAIKQK